MKKNLLKNPFFHGAILVALASVMIFDVGYNGVKSIKEMSTIGKVCAYIFMADLCGFVAYVTIWKMIIKRK